MARAAARPPDAPPGVPLLAAAPTPGWLAAVGNAAQADPTFARRPLSDGAPAETGALARQQADPLLAAIVHRSRAQARHLARLRELALLLAGPAPSAAGALALPGGLGLGWAENARGRLLHLARVEQGRAVLYRIVAPTEWNFHPQGALARALVGSAAGDAAALQNRVRWLVDSLDPCVDCRVEIEDA